MILKLEDPSEIVRTMWQAYAAGDTASALLYFSDSIAFGIFVPQDVLPFGGGETIGKAALSDRIELIRDQFDLLHYEGNVLAASGNTVRGQVLYAFKHKTTGEVIEGVMRQVIDVEDGKIIRLHEFHDVERLRAFMRLVSVKTPL